MANVDSSKIDYDLLLPQCLVGLIDAISFMVVAPSLVFYVRAMGGSKEQYGAILSIFSFASFSFKPVLGYWCDKSGCRFRSPYLFSIAIAAIGGLVYFLASAFTGSVALHLILLGRFLGGVGAANSTLGYTYIAQVIPESHMTKANALLSMVRIFGMAAAPGLNILLSKVSGDLVSFEITPLNCIGIVLFVGNMASFVVIYLMLREPPEETKPESSSVDDVDERSWKFWKSFLSLEIIVPIISILSLNANFQLLETGLAPAGSHALGWGPVEISTVFGLNAVCIFLVILLTFQLSAMGVTDGALLVVGLVASIIGYILMYLWWSTSSPMAFFVVPIFFSCVAFPFMGAPTRSLFTRIVAGNEYLRYHQGTMQAVLSMAASVAGFAAPGLIAAFVLRTPDQVDASQDHRELTPYALFAPISSAIVLIGVVYLRLNPPVVAELDEESMRESEMSALLSTHDLFIPSKFHPRTEAHRRHSVAVMGITQLSFHSPTMPKGGRHSLTV
jgi:MFS family permease